MMRDLGVILQQQGLEVRAKGPGSRMDSLSLEIKVDAWQDEPFRCEEVLDASDISQPRRYGCNVSWSRWLGLVKWQLCWPGNKTFGLPDKEQALKVFAKCVLFKLEFFFDIDSNEHRHKWIATLHDQRVELGMENLAWRQSPNAQHCDFAWTATSQEGVRKSGPKVTLEWVHEYW